MVFLSKIYTKVGDQGQTHLGDASFVVKYHPRVEAYGEVDELNAVIGVAMALAPDFAEVSLLYSIQNELFDVGADLCVPIDAQAEAHKPRLRITEAQITRLEHEIDRLNEKLGALTSFVLPGGTPAAALMHQARTVCRRAERRGVQLFDMEPDKVNRQALIYLNRLSDLLFVLARVANVGGVGDVLWVPGQSRQGTVAEVVTGS